MGDCESSDCTPSRLYMVLRGLWLAEPVRDMSEWRAVSCIWIMFWRKAFCSRQYCIRFSRSTARWLRCNQYIPMRVANMPALKHDQRQTIMHVCRVCLPPKIQMATMMYTQDGTCWGVSAEAPQTPFSTQLKVVHLWTPNVNPSMNTDRTDRRTLYRHRKSHREPSSAYRPWLTNHSRGPGSSYPCKDTKMYGRLGRL